MNKIDEFKFALEFPQVYLRKHFKDLRDQINREAEKMYLTTNTKEVQIQINRKKLAMVEIVDNLEKECLSDCDLIAENNLKQLNEIIISLDNKDEKEFNSRFTAYKRMLFHDKNLIFIHKINVTGHLSDPTAFGKLVLVKKYNL